MRSPYMRFFYGFLVCLFGASCLLVAQDNQDNQPHIQPRSNEDSSPLKPKSNANKQPQTQPSPEQPSAAGGQQPAIANPNDPASSDSSSRDSDIDLNATSGAELPVPAEDKDDGGFRPYDPHRAMKDLEVGNYYLKQKNYRAALERFNDALKYKPDDAEATFNLAFTQEKLDLLEEARKNYSRYMELLPKGPKVKDCQEGLQRVEARLTVVAGSKPPEQEAAEDISVGETFLARNDFISARQRFEAAVRLAPDNPVACFRLAQSLRGMEQLEPARLYYRKYLELDPRGTFADDAKKAITDITYIVGK